MKPLGRKYYLDKSGGKHKFKVYGKTYAWWDDVIASNKARDKSEYEKDIES